MPVYTLAGWAAPVPLPRSVDDGYPFQRCEVHCPRCGTVGTRALRKPVTVHALVEVLAEHGWLHVHPWPEPRWVPGACGWCGQSWPRQWVTRAAARRYLVRHMAHCLRSRTWHMLRTALDAEHRYV